MSAGQTVFTLATSEARDVVFDIADPRRLSTPDAKERVFHVALLSDPAVKTIGTLRDISPQADPQTRTWQVRVALNNPPAGMALGASATIEMPSSVLPGYKIPATALSRTGDKPAIFVIDNNGQAQLREVTLSGYVASFAFVSSGLHPGDKVITAGVNKLRDGEKVIPGERQS